MSKLTKRPERFTETIDRRRDRSHAARQRRVLLFVGNRRRGLAADRRQSGSSRVARSAWRKSLPATSKALLRTSTNFSTSLKARVSLTAARLWQGRMRTAHAMAALSLAQLAVTLVPLRRWRSTLGAKPCKEPAEPDVKAGEARRIAGAVERAAERLPFATKCLPRAVALSWLLRRRAIGHSLVIAIRPPHLRRYSRRPSCLGRGRGSQDHRRIAWAVVRNVAARSLKGERIPPVSCNSKRS